MARVLIVEDESNLAQGLLFNLQAEGHEVAVEGDGDAALESLRRNSFDAVVLDVMLPGKNGFEVATALRADGNYVPLLMLTARGRPEDVVQGFAAGADDYLQKPFDLSVLIARLNALLRRMHWTRRVEKSGAVEEELAEFAFAGRRIDFETLTLHAPDRTVRLTLMEADLLRYLARNRERIVSRKELLEQVWHVREDTDTRAIDNFIVRLRRYIEDDPAAPRYLQTVRGVGYRFMPNPEVTAV
ncbi:MAG TPA: response regulator transcription factor [Acidobacteriaceae bacterium]|jgi:DNA-binding response OmpR family regulator|nr:response regulator transcription factor [Acidobacteriaceae bacterium]